MLKVNANGKLQCFRPYAGIAYAGITTICHATKLMGLEMGMNLVRHHSSSKDGGLNYCTTTSSWYFRNEQPMLEGWFSKPK